jgi:hypothetical protein
LRDVKRKYGLSEKDFISLRERQMNCCALCGKHRSKQKRDLHVDHDHETGRVRGMLCTCCNVRLGWFENRKDLVLNYVKNSEAK